MILGTGGQPLTQLPPSCHGCKTTAPGTFTTKELLFSSSVWVLFHLHPVLCVEVKETRQMIQLSEPKQMLSTQTAWSYQLFQDSGLNP